MRGIIVNPRRHVEETADEHFSNNNPYLEVFFFCFYFTAEPCVVIDRLRQPLEMNQSARVFHSLNKGLEAERLLTEATRHYGFSQVYLFTVFGSKALDNH